MNNENEFNISPIVTENFKILNNSKFYEQFRWKSGNLDRLLSYSEEDFYYNPTRLKNNCIAEQRWYDPNQNFSFLTKLDIATTNLPDVPKLIRSIPLTSFKLLKLNNYKLFTINMFDIYSLEKLKSVSK